MNRAFGFLLVLFPGMLVAQSNLKPSQHSPALQANLISPPPRPSPNEAPAGPARAVSTGLVRPRLVHTIPIVRPGHTMHLTAKKLEVTVAYTVDETGTPLNPHIVASGNPMVDEELLEAVMQFRYTPGTLDGENISFPMTLHYVLEPGAEY